LQLLRHTPLAVNILLLALIGSMLASFARGLRRETPFAPAKPEAVPAAARPDLERIIAARLFGEALIPGDEAPLGPAETTALALRLDGILVQPDDAASRALIARGEEEAEPYSADEEVMPGVRLLQIHPRHVVLENRGRRELLWLDEASRERAEASTRETPEPESDEPVLSLSEARSEVLADPELASQYFRFSPVQEDGRIKGYHLFPGTQQDLFITSNLQPGDLLIAVNGMSLTDGANLAQALETLRHASRVELSVLRDGEPQQLSIDFD